MSSPRILVIGSGAVGAVYGHHLAQAGCHISFLVRDRNSANSAMPRTLHRHGLLGGIRSHNQLLRVQTRGDGGWDQVWLCLPSTALEDPWLYQQLDAIGPASPVLLWTPNMRDRDILAARHGADITRALIGLISYQSPLPGESSPGPGIAYLAPPDAAVLEDTPSGRYAAGLLTQGGLRARVHKDLPAHVARMTALLQPLIAALEVCDWSLDTLSRSHWLATAAAAIAEARHTSATYLGQRPPRQLPGTRWLARLAIKIVPPLSPLPMQTYLHYHFGKVSAQTRLMLDGWIAQGAHQQFPTPALRALRDALP